MSDSTEDITPEDSTSPIYLDPTPPAPVGPAPADMTVEEMRQRQYILRSDPLFFKWQRGEATEQEWLDEVEAVRAEYPEGGDSTDSTG